MITSLHFEIWK